VGRHRSHNEDRFLVSSDARIVAVADGMGGHSAGEVAAQMALDALVEQFITCADEAPRDATARLVRAITAANERVITAGQSEAGRRGMGTTIAAAAFTGEVAVIAHVGDSRVYLLRGDTLSRLTCDHSLLEQTIKVRGPLSPEARAEIPTNVILRALGVSILVEVETSVVALEPGDRLLFCSDGLSGMVVDEALRAILSAARDRDVALTELIRSANAAGGEDNITAIVVDVE
jgi:serine/threonine protein phosphatase PrpC